MNLLLTYHYEKFIILNASGAKMRCCGGEMERWGRNRVSKTLCVRCFWIKTPCNGSGRSELIHQSDFFEMIVPHSCAFVNDFTGYPKNAAVLPWAVQGRSRVI